MEYDQRHPRRTDTPGRHSGGKRQAPPTQESGNHHPRRPRRRSFGLWGSMLYVCFVLGASALLACLGWTWACDVLALNKPAHSAVITLSAEKFTEQPQTSENGTTDTVTVADLNYVADQLKDNGLIEYKSVFKLFAGFTHSKYKLSPGTYELNTDMDYRALIGNMGRSSSSRMTTTVTITEGMTEAQIFALLEKSGVSTVAQLEDTAANYDFKFSFLKDVRPLGDAKRLEGYLFPDTYEFYMGEDPVSALNKMILRFDQIFTDEMRQQATDQGYTIHEILTIASLIEKETDGSDQRNISSVIRNRLSNTSYETVGLLQIDAAIAYATGRAVTVDDYATIDSPYNTYLYKGLPPTPIANPGAVALQAALNPNSTNYYYYALGDDGVHHFFQRKSELDRFLNS